MVLRRSSQGLKKERNYSDLGFNGDVERTSLGLNLLLFIGEARLALQVPPCTSRVITARVTSHHTSKDRVSYPCMHMQPVPLRRVDNCFG